MQYGWKDGAWKGSGGLEKGGNLGLVDDKGQGCHVRGRLMGERTVGHGVSGNNNDSGVGIIDGGLDKKYKVDMVTRMLGQRDWTWKGNCC